MIERCSVLNLLELMLTPASTGNLIRIPIDVPCLHAQVHGGERAAMLRTGTPPPMSILTSDAQPSSLPTLPCTAAMLTSRSNLSVMTSSTGSPAPAQPLEIASNESCSRLSAPCDEDQPIVLYASHGQDDLMGIEPKGAQQHAHPDRPSNNSMESSTLINLMRESLGQGTRWTAPRPTSSLI